ncbi:Vi polysaccharide biosynthesis protein VipA/TviB [Helicobacter sp. 12S02634-8]|uniref:nucleotide sugar dehydrogenase n=1 Tax=Helicobacter sp. 12S02634-8 TaxID=1476199 RepID=UPI000BA7CA85|nr:nucleotide sugar dehydrogenase [Helicobacter sp. 12S02634-8]PAF48107.1 Vi polysaccharide biosynthesis protein VipA/TviB [Helicobacter sp. 12S02634-8]
MHNTTNTQDTTQAILQDKIIAIIGLGYVGLPLAIEFGKRYPTIGFDTNPLRIQELSNHTDSNHQTPSDAFAKAHLLHFSNDPASLGQANIYIIAVPTPIDTYKTPDISALLAASKMVGEVLKQGDIIIYESTTYPTCTENDCLPILQKYSKLRYNQDFFIGYSPERINPGDRKNTLTNIIKITAGSTQEAAKTINALYASIIPAGTYLAPSIKVAEAAKAIENAQRDLNIAFMNELALIFERLQIDTHEVIKAASTKWNFLHFTPGLVGGHCIGVDPYYLTHIATSLGYHPKVIAAGRYINDFMPDFIAQKMIKLLAKKHISALGAKILILGVTFKENCPDIRNSKVAQVQRALMDFGCEVYVYDPIASKEAVLKEYGFELLDPHSLQNPNQWEETQKYNALLLAVGHASFKTLKPAELLTQNSVIYDLKGFFDCKVDARL